MTSSAEWKELAKQRGWIDLYLPSDQFAQFLKTERSQIEAAAGTAGQHVFIADAVRESEIDAAFASNDDPLVGVKAGEAYDALFRRIASLAPPPIGLGFER